MCILQDDNRVAPELEAAAVIDDAHHLLRIAYKNAETNHGINQELIAEYLGVTPGRVSQIINGEDDLRLSTLARYLRALGTYLGLSLYPAGRPNKRPVAGLSIQAQANDLDRSLENSESGTIADSKFEVRLHKITKRSSGIKNSRVYLATTYEPDAIQAGEAGDLHD